MRWSLSQLRTFVASGEDVVFVDERGGELAAPVSLVDACPRRPTRLWDGALSTVHAADRTGILWLENAAAVEPGRVHEAVFHAKVDGDWHRLRARVVNLMGQPEIRALVRVLEVVEQISPPGADAEPCEEELWVRLRCDAGGTITAAEGTVEALFGLSADELVGTSSMDLSHPDDLHIIVEGGYVAYQAPGRETTHDLRISRSDGSAVPVMVTISITPELDEFRIFVRDAGQVLRRELNEALAADQFFLEYQPVWKTDSVELVAAEALVRWRHPERGLVPPGDFIPGAESTGCITTIGSWVLRQACRDAATWPSHLRVSVNLSVRQLADPAIVEHVSTALSSSGLDPHRLVVEVTESALMEDAERGLAHLQALKALGVRLAIDDFGTGFSSLQYLAQMPVDILKVDRSFVAGLGVDDRHTTIVTSVIALAHALGLLVVAEGVETDAQHRQLRALGCDGGQGFLWSRPLPIDRFRQLVEQRLTASAA
jgi:PAS domain S-box-containing protein